MDEDAIMAVRRRGRFAFVATVTTVLLALTFAGFAHGGTDPVQPLVYAFAAGFGLEFVGSAWREQWRAGVD